MFPIPYPFPFLSLLPLSPHSPFPFPFSFLPSSLPLPSLFVPLSSIPARRSASAVSSPAGSEAEPQPRLNLVHFKWKKSHKATVWSIWWVPYVQCCCQHRVPVFDHHFLLTIGVASLTHQVQQACFLTCRSVSVECIAWRRLCHIRISSFQKTAQNPLL